MLHIGDLKMPCIYSTGSSIILGYLSITWRCGGSREAPNTAVLSYTPSGCELRHREPESWTSLSYKYIQCFSRRRRTHRTEQVRHGQAPRCCCWISCHHLWHPCTGQCSHLLWTRCFACIKHSCCVEFCRGLRTSVL